jgi:hypothetical protein
MYEIAIGVYVMNIIEFYTKIKKFDSDDTDDSVVEAIKDLSFTIGKSKMNIDVLYHIISYLYIDGITKHKFERVCTNNFHILDEKGIKYVVLI